MEKNDDRKVIAVVGFGAAGSRIAYLLSKQLDASKYRLVVISPRPLFILYPATARLIVSDQHGLGDRPFVPVDKVLNGKGKFVQGKVTAIEENKQDGGGNVVLDNGERVPYHILVLATGCSWDYPLSFPENADEIPAYLNRTRDAFAKAQNIVLVGAGAVGCELAGEIKDIWPTKKVTIVHGSNLPLSDFYPDKFRRALETSLRERNVDFVLGDFVDEFPAEGATQVKTRSGRVLESDLVLSTRGQRFDTEFIAKSLGADVIGNRGLVKIQPTFQVLNRKDIFAIGDIIDWDEQKQAAKAIKHGDVAAKNVLAYLKGKQLQEYKGVTEMIGITNGRNGGVLYLDVLWGILLGNWVVRTVKAKGLFVDVLRGNVGA